MDLISNPEANTYCIIQFRNVSAFSFKGTSDMFDSYVSVPICYSFFFKIFLPSRKRENIISSSCIFQSTIDSSEI